MRSYELHIIESGEDIAMALVVGLLAHPPYECEKCGQYLTVPFTVILDEHDNSVSLCGDCQPVLH